MKTKRPEKITIEICIVLGDILLLFLELFLEYF